MDEDKQRFPLTIQLSVDGIDWTHFYGAMRHVRTPAELPDPLWTQLLPIVEWLIARNETRFVLDTHSLDEAPEEARETLTLTAWWMEFDHRRVLAHDRQWKCPDCDDEVTPRRGYCNNPRCESWDKLFTLTGEPALRLVARAETA